MSQLSNPFAAFEYTHGEVLTCRPDLLQPNRIPPAMVVEQRHLVELPDGSYQHRYMVRVDTPQGPGYMDVLEQELTEYPQRIRLHPPVADQAAPEPRCEQGGEKTCSDRPNKEGHR